MITDEIKEEEEPIFIISNDGSQSPEKIEIDSKNLPNSENEDNKEANCDSSDSQEFIKNCRRSKSCRKNSKHFVIYDSSFDDIDSSSSSSSKNSSSSNKSNEFVKKSTNFRSNFLKPNNSYITPEYIHSDSDSNSQNSRNFSDKISKKTENFENRSQISRKSYKNRIKGEKSPNISQNALPPPPLCLICENAQLSSKLSQLYFEQHDFKFGDFDISKITLSFISSLLDAPASFIKFFKSISSFPFCLECLGGVEKIAKTREKIRKLEIEILKEVDILREKVKKCLGKVKIGSILKSFWKKNKENIITSKNLRNEFRKRIIVDEKSRELLKSKILSLDPESSNFEFLSISHEPAYLRRHLSSSQFIEIKKYTENPSQALNSSQKSTNLKKYKHKNLVDLNQSLLKVEGNAASFCEVGLDDSFSDNYQNNETNGSNNEIMTNNFKKSRSRSSFSLKSSINSSRSRSSSSSFSSKTSSSSCSSCSSKKSSNSSSSSLSSKNSKNSSSSSTSCSSCSGSDFDVDLSGNKSNKNEPSKKKKRKKKSKRKKSPKLKSTKNRSKNESEDKKSIGKIPCLKYPFEWKNFPSADLRIDEENRIFYEEYEIKCIEDDPLDLYFICVTCDQKFYLRDLIKPKKSKNHRLPFRHMINHIKIFHKEIYKCHECDVVLKSRDNYNEHLKKSSMHNPNHAQYTHITCEVCGKTCPKTRLRFHIWSHKSQEEKDECIKNGEIEPISASKKYHMISKSKSKNFNCETCKRGFLTKKRFEAHFKTSCTSERLLCPLCGKSYANRNGLSAHMRIQHEPERLPVKNYCHFCNKRFYSLNIYKNHMMIHSNVKPFPCTICSKSFRRKFHLKSHLISCAKRHSKTNENSTSTKEGEINNRISESDFISEEIPHVVYVNETESFYY